MTSHDAITCWDSNICYSFYVNVEHFTILKVVQNKKVLLRMRAVNIPASTQQEVKYTLHWCEWAWIKQDSHPAGNRKRCTARGITCPSITCLGCTVPHPDLARGGGYPSPGPGGTHLTRTRVPPVWDWDIPSAWDWSTPWEGASDQSLGYPPGKDMGPVEVLWDGLG